MCGIFGYTGSKTNAAEVVLDGLKKLEYRGYDSWGVSVSGAKGKISVCKNVGKIGNATVKTLSASTIGIGHTRWATHGGVTKKNSHPHLSCDKNISLIHNGIIENYDTLREKLVTQCHTFISETDSEVAVHLVEQLRKKYDLTESVRKAFLKLKGLNALVVMESDSESLVAVSNGSPVVVGFGEHENMVASDADALTSHTKTVYYLKDSELVYVNKDTVTLFDTITGKKKSFKKIVLEHGEKASQKGEFKHFMLKEIYEQPQIITSIANDTTMPDRKLAQIIKESFGTYLVGCGTAAYACLAGSYLFSKVAKTHVNWAVGSEFGYHLDFLKNKSLVLALSQSGETMDILESVKKAKTKKATLACLVNVYGSSLFRESHYNFMVGAGPEKAVASTKAFIGMLSHLLLTSYALKGSYEDGKKTLLKASKSVKDLLGKDGIKSIKKLARKIAQVEHIYVVGRGLSYPASLEVALKIKEMSYIHTEGFAAGELKHGVISLITKGTPCIVFAPHDETYGANISGAMELKARGGYIIGVSNKDHEVFDYHISVKDALEGTIIPNVVFGQLLAYYLAIERDCDPDMPRNLAKSVTVK